MSVFFDGHAVRRMQTRQDSDMKRSVLVRFRREPCNISFEQRALTQIN